MERHLSEIEELIRSNHVAKCLELAEGKHLTDTGTTRDSVLFYGSFKLPEMDSGTDSDSDSKPDGYIVLCRTFHIAQTRTWIPIPYFCTGQESESESVPQSVYGNINEP